MREKPTPGHIVTLVILAFTLILTPMHSARAADPLPPTPAYPPEQKVVFLTFDDGPFSPGTQQVLDVLAEYDVHATFFIIGRQAIYDQETIKKIYDAGHGLGNHGFNHYSLLGPNWAFFEAEVMDTHDTLGDKDSMCLRPPYGDYDDTTIQWAAELGYDVVRWTVDPQDWRLPGAAAIADHVIERIHPHAIVLLHDGGGDRSQTVEALRLLIPRLRAGGWKFKALCRDVPWEQVEMTPTPTPETGAAPMGEVTPTQPATMYPLMTTIEAPAAAAVATPAPAAVRALGADSTPSPGHPGDAPQLRPPGSRPSAAPRRVTETRTPQSSRPAPAATLTPAAVTLSSQAAGAIVAPGPGEIVRGVTEIVAFAADANFVRWQLDLVHGSDEPIFLAQGETPVPQTSALVQWDTRTYANGVYILRLRAIRDDGNYDEFFQHIVVRN